jgi:hypothetical protein
MLFARLAIALETCGLDRFHEVTAVDREVHRLLCLSCSLLLAKLAAHWRNSFAGTGCPPADNFSTLQYKFYSQNNLALSNSLHDQFVHCIVHCMVRSDLTLADVLIALDWSRWLEGVRGTFGCLHHTPFRTSMKAETGKLPVFLGSVHRYRLTNPNLVWMRDTIRLGLRPAVFFGSGQKKRQLFEDKQCVRTRFR